MKEFNAIREKFIALRCCGNCGRNDGKDCICEHPNHAVCSYWMPDNMSYGQREKLMEDATFDS